METGIVVEKKELFFLLSCKGCRCCPSMFEPIERIRPEEILESLFHKGWINNSGEQFQVSHWIADTVRQITQAKKLLCLCHGNPERELLYLYPGEQVLAVQEIFTRKNALRLLCLDKGNFQLFLDEQGFLSVDQRWEPMPFMDDAVKLLPEQLCRRSELTAFRWIRLLTQVLDGQSGGLLEMVGIVRKGLQEMIVEEDRVDGSMAMELYTAEKFTEKLLKKLFR